MQIHLSRFEQSIDNVILKRGMYYFLENKVEPPELIAPGKLHSVVYGSDDYEVTLMLQEDLITDFVCTCPYDLGPVCKHVVAVIYYLQQDKLGLANDEKIGIPGKRGRPKRAVEKEPKKKEQTGQPSSKPARRGRPRPIVASAPEALKQPVTQTTGKASKQERDEYARQIRAILKSAAGRGKFIDWNHVGLVGKAVFAILKQTEQDIVRGHLRKAFLISCAVLEEMTKALDFADDSDGDIGGNIETAITILDQLAKMDLDEPLRLELFHYALEKYIHQEFEGWDWHTGMAELALSTFRGNDQALKLMQALETTPHSKYEEEEVQLIRMQLIGVIHGREEANQFLQRHLRFRRFRILAIEDAFEVGDYDRVKALAHEGIRQDREKSPGWLSGWYDWLIKIAILEKDDAHIIEYARIQLLKHNNTKQPYFELLKTYTATANWKAEVELLIGELMKSGRHWSSDFIPEMLVREEWWDRLLHYFQDDARQWGVRISQLNQFAPHLVKRFPDAFADLYEAGIRHDVYPANSRKQYQYICRDLRQLKKLGFIERVGEIVRSLIKEYPQRTALVDELGRV